MKNREIDAAWSYHNGTKHSYESVRTSRHYLDWDKQPIPFKIFSELEPISLTEHLSSSVIPAISAISSRTAARLDAVAPTRQTVRSILFLSAGPRGPSTYSPGEPL